jgi:rhodanese-related sulfurtransferase
VDDVPGAAYIPPGQLRARLAELPRDKGVLVICRSGQRAYWATQLLLRNETRRGHAVTVSLAAPGELNQCMGHGKP